MSKPFRFPDPRDRSKREHSVFCPAQRVRELYNQATGENSTKIYKKTRLWFRAAAKKYGWVTIHPLKDVSTRHAAGFLLSTKTLTFTPQPERAFRVVLKKTPKKNG